MAKSCPACTSPNREEIERRLKAKDSVRSISKWLLAEKNEVIPFSTLFKHSNVHMIQAANFVDKLLSIPKLFVVPSPLMPSKDDLPSDSALPPLEALAHVQNKALFVVDALSARMATGGITPQEVTLYNASLKEARQAAKHRHELVFGKRYHVTHETPRNPQLKEASTQDIKKRLEELKRAKKERERVE